MLARPLAVRYHGPAGSTAVVAVEALVRQPGCEAEALVQQPDGKAASGRAEARLGRYVPAPWAAGAGRGCAAEGFGLLM